MGKHENGRMVRGVAFVALGIASMVFTPVGCGTQQPERGAMAQAGHDIDHADEHTGH